MHWFLQMFNWLIYNNNNNSNKQISIGCNFELPTIKTLTLQECATIKTLTTVKGNRDQMYTRPRVLNFTPLNTLINFCKCLTGVLIWVSNSEQHDTERKTYKPTMSRLSCHSSSSASFVSLSELLHSNRPCNRHTHCHSRTTTTVMTAQLLIACTRLSLSYDGLTICFKSSKPIQIGLCMLTSLSIHLHGLHHDAQYGQTWHLSTQLHSGERTGRRLLWSTTLLLPTLLHDSQVSISLITHGLWWTISGQVKAHVMLTCINRDSPNHLLVIVASDRPWTTLLTPAH